MKIYISGKITGLPYDEVVRKFGEAERRIHATQNIPVNPLRNGVHISADWVKHMEADIRMLMTCDAILLLPDWKDSPGARIEKTIAEGMNLIILTHHD